MTYMLPTYVLPVELQGDYENLGAFPNLYHGWEMDDWSWIVKNKATGEVAYASTAHGRPFVRTGEKARDIVRGFLDDYEEAVSCAVKALDMLS